MDQRQKTRRFGWYVILCACILRLSVSDLPGRVAPGLPDMDSSSFPIYSETGRNVRFSSSSGGFFRHFRESPAPWIPEPEPETIAFSEESLVFAAVDYDCALRPDLKKLVEKEPDWDLQGEEPSVLILHTHATESYEKAGEDYTETTRYRTLEEAYNMVCVGDLVAELLTAAGIGVIHDRQLHDYPSYNGAYVHARKSTRQILQDNPSIRLVLDLHRDASAGETGQMRTEAVADGEPSAQLMFVVGTDAASQSHENWEENLCRALQLHIQLERSCPGIMRPLNLRAQRFNQDLLPGAMLVEVGAAGNTRQEALAAARKLGETLIRLSENAKLQKKKTPAFS